jgi:hypothetical protein
MALPDETVADPASYPGIFDFELDFGGSLRCIPMSVRMKLDEVGIKLSLKQWNRMPEPQRRQLVERPCGEAAEAAAYRQYLTDQIKSFTRSEVEFAPVNPLPEWADPGVMPERIAAWARSLEVDPPSAAQWASLTPLQRFALFKLTRPGHSNENFLPAMREFALLP